MSKRRLKIERGVAESDWPALESSELLELPVVEPPSLPWLLERLKLSKVTSPVIRLLEKRALPVLLEAAGVETTGVEGTAAPVLLSGTLLPSERAAGPDPSLLE